MQRDQWCDRECHEVHREESPKQSPTTSDELESDAGTFDLIREPSEKGRTDPSPADYC